VSVIGSRESGDAFTWFRWVPGWEPVVAWTNGKGRSEGCTWALWRRRTTCRGENLGSVLTDAFYTVRRLKNGGEFGFVGVVWRRAGGPSMTHTQARGGRRHRPGYGGAGCVLARWEQGIWRWVRLMGGVQLQCGSTGSNPSKKRFKQFWI
jgi:hypothetical protein